MHSSEFELYKGQLLSNRLQWLFKHLYRSLAEFPHAVAGGFVNEERLAFPEAPVPRAPSTCAAHLRSIIIIRILHTLVPAAVVVVIQRLCPLPVVAGANAGHGAERAGQLPPRATAVMLRTAAVRSWHRRDALRAQNKQKAHGFPEIKVTATRERAVFGGVRQVWDGDGWEIHKVLALRFHH